MLSVGIDMGGTFTDGYFVGDGGAVTCKVPTYRFDLTRSVVLCLRAGAEALNEDLARLLERIDVLRLATTVGTNMVIEGTGSRVGLFVQNGSEDMLYGSGRAEALFKTFVAPEMVRGTSWSPEPAEVLQSCRTLVDLGVRQIVVSAPFGADAHNNEKRIRSIVRERYPEHYLRSVPLQLATDVSACPEDDVRTNTAVVNAYLHRDMASLLHRADDELRSEGLGSPLLVVHANSGVARVAKSTAISTYGSGPSAGLSGAAWIAGVYGDPLVVTADMGGTTLDLGLVVDGVPESEPRPVVAGVEVSLAMNRTHSVGCGGSSVAEVVDGRVVVGPRSAGAVPGPASFARGGESPTLTDADLLVGLLRAGQEFGGQFVLDEAPARSAIERCIAVPLACSVEDAAAAVENAATAGLEDALRRLMKSRGIQPSEVVMYPFGGSGPLHLWAAAHNVGIRRIRSFPFGSGFSAFGCTVVDLRHRYEESWSGSSPDEAALARILSPMVSRGIYDVVGEGFSPELCRAQVRLIGPKGQGISETEEIEDIQREQALDRMCRELIDRTGEWNSVSVVVVDVTVPIPGPFLPRARLPKTGSPRSETRMVGWSTGVYPTEALRWHDLVPGRWIDGPVLLEERDSTHAVGPDWRVVIDELGNALWEAAPDG